VSISGCPFKYDGIMSTQYGLIITNINTDYNKTKLDGSQVYSTTYIPATNRFYIFDRKIKEPLTFEVEITSNESNKYLSVLQQRSIVNWLFDRASYHKFEIMNKDYAGLYFNCYFTDTETLNYGMGCMGYKFTVVCDAAWAWENPKTYTYSFTTLPSTVNFINNSDYEDYLYPLKTIITCGATGGTISITNKNDNNKAVQFTELVPNEVVTINDINQVISSTGINRYDNWNKNLLRFANINNQRNNYLYVTGDVKKIDIEYQNARRIGY
jgi:hypothetical protein